MFWKKRKKQTDDMGNNDPMACVERQADIKVVIRTDLGNVRTNNEDAAAFFRMADDKILREKGYLLIVADGMGGHQAGEVASNMAVETISESYYRHSIEQHKENLLARAFEAANSKIFEKSSSSEVYRGMGTTCTAIVLHGNNIYFAHVGDSRAYLLKNHSIIQLTEDHTYVQELLKKGDISAAEAHVHEQRNILTNAMGTKPSMRVDTGKSEFIFENKDRIMICSDGLYDYFTDVEIGAILLKGSLQDAADMFIAEAKRRGGKDNITVLIASLAVTEENGLKETREADLPKLTRDADIPAGLNNI